MCPLPEGERLTGEMIYFFKSCNRKSFWFMPDHFISVTENATTLTALLAQWRENFCIGKGSHGQVADQQ